MATYWYLSKFLEDSDRPLGAGVGPVGRRSKVMDYQAQGDVIGSVANLDSKNGWTLVRVESASPPTIPILDTDVISIPVESLDATVGVTNETSVNSDLTTKGLVQKIDSDDSWRVGLRK